MWSYHPSCPIITEITTTTAESTAEIPTTQQMTTTEDQITTTQTTQTTETTSYIKTTTENPYTATTEEQCSCQMQLSVLIKILTLTTNMSQNVDLLQELLQKGPVGEARQATTEQHTTDHTTFSTQVKIWPSSVVVPQDNNFF